MIQEAINRYLLRTKQNSLSPKAVLFDMDGVLYDSMRFHARFSQLMRRRKSRSCILKSGLRSMT